MSLSFFSFPPFFNLPLPVQQLEFQMTVKRERVCDVRFPSLLPMVLFWRLNLLKEKPVTLPCCCFFRCRKAKARAPGTGVCSNTEEREAECVQVCGSLANA